MSQTPDRAAGLNGLAASLPPGTVATDREVRENYGWDWAREPKRAAWPDQLGPHVMALQQAIRNALDPHNIMNPGAVLEHFSYADGPRSKAAALWR